jgi:hypothetical protein
MTIIHCGDTNYLDVNFLEQSDNLNHGIVGRVCGSLWGIAGPKVVSTQTTLNDFHNHVIIPITTLTPLTTRQLSSTHLYHIHISSHLSTSIFTCHLPSCPLIPSPDWVLASTSPFMTDGPSTILEKLSRRYTWKLTGSMQNALSFQKIRYRGRVKS